ncbi:MAG: gamma-D-glutamyl-L-lysine dipeptidyl-peptidase, partial [Phycisphaerales bacterium]|nr:gamma-D-glutamyl-L-lysine dipeptidyl-peptidase [Phycisphaerales bacterium]
MKDQIEKVLADVAAKYNDRRLHVCNVTVDAAEEGAVKIAGRVLEAAYLDAIRQSLPANVKLDVANVQVLRRAKTQTLTVATNLTDLHVEPSFLSELLTQVTNGVTLEVLEEKDKWCFVRQADGYLGWAYKPYLAAAGPINATHIVAAPTMPIFAEGKNPPEPLSRLLGGTAVEVTRVEHDCAHVRLAGEMFPKGWVPRQYLRPLASLPIASTAARPQMIADARALRGTYYLWGGGSAFGIDCSGLAQLVHRLSGYTIPRDADLQFAAGRPVEGENFQPGDLLFFINDHERRKISHVGISTGGWNMIHSSRFHNGVYEDDVQARPHLRDNFA